MKPSRLTLGLALAASLAIPFAHAADAPAKTKPALGSFGVDLTSQDTKVRPGDDFNRYVNGHWLDTYQLKDYETSYGSFNALRDRSEEQVHAIIEELQQRKDLTAGSEAQKVRDYYASYMDRAARDAAGIKPLQPVLDKIAKIKSKDALIAAFGNTDLDGTNAPVGFGVSLDRSDHAVVLGPQAPLDQSLQQAALGLVVVDHARFADPGFLRDGVDREPDGTVANRDALGGIENGIGIDRAVAGHGKWSGLNSNDRSLIAFAALRQDLGSKEIHQPDRHDAGFIGMMPKIPA